MLVKNLLVVLSATLVTLAQAAPSPETTEAVSVPEIEDIPDVSELAELADVENVKPGLTFIDDDEGDLELFDETELPGKEFVKRDPQCSAPCRTDGLLFHTPITQFINNYRKKKFMAPTLDWASDNCSVPKSVAKALKINKDKPRGYNFIASCNRHDFGYQNYRKQHRLTAAGRAKIDSNFKADMYNVCKQYHGWSSWKGVECRKIANVYYTMVRLCGTGNCTVAKVKKILKAVF